MRNESDLSGDRSNGSAVIEFGRYLLDTEQRSLTFDGEPIRLPPKTFELLIFLVEHDNRVVRKNEIFENVWHDSFVEDANLVVHISNLRRVFSEKGDLSVAIETFPTIGYRFNAKVRRQKKVHQRSDAAEDDISSADLAKTADNGNRLIVAGEGRSGFIHIQRKWFFLSLVGTVLVTLGAVGIAAALYFSYSGFRYNPVDENSYKGNPCPPDTYSPTPRVGRCEDPVVEFSNVNNPNGNRSYGFTPFNNSSRFILFEHADHDTHPSSPETPVDVWRRTDEFQPMIAHNATKMDLVIQDGIVLPPTLFELHPGPDLQRSTLRWTAPARGTYHLQGQFRGINFAGHTNSDAAVVQNAKVTHFTAHILGFNFEKAFDLTINAEKGDTIDFSVGVGLKWYEGDSTGFSATVTTLSLE